MSAPSGNVPFYAPTGDPGGGGYEPGNIYRLFAVAGQFFSVGGVDTDVMSFDIPADALENNGDSLRILIGGKSTGVETKTARVRIGGVEICVQPMTTAANGYFFEIHITKNTADNAAWQYGRIQRAIGFVQSIDNNNISVDWSVLNTFLVRLQTVTNNTIEMNFCQIDLFKVPV